MLGFTRKSDRAEVNEIILRLSQKIGGCLLQVGRVPSGSLLTQPRTAITPSRPSIKATKHRFRCRDGECVRLKSTAHRPLLRSGLRTPRLARRCIRYEEGSKLHG
jgi:hypothetical protein